MKYSTIILSLQMLLIASADVQLVNLTNTVVEVSCSTPVHIKGFGDGSPNNTASIECNLLFSPTKWTSSTSEWRIAEQHNVEIAKIHQDSNIVSNSTLKHYETTGYVSFLQSSSIISSEVEVYVVFFLDKEPVNSQAFSITVGTNFELYLIVSIGFIFGFLLIITIVVMMRRRKHNSRSSEYHGEVNITNSEDQNDETLIWTNVNLNSSTRNYNTFSQIFGADNAGYIEGVSSSEALNDINTSMENENYKTQQSKYIISQISNNDPALNRHEYDALARNEMTRDDNLKTCLGRAVVAIGGAADVGAGQLRVSDNEEVETVIQDSGTGYTAVRTLTTREFGYLPTSSLIFK